MPPSLTACPELTLNELKFAGIFIRDLRFTIHDSRFTVCDLRFLLYTSESLLEDFRLNSSINEANAKD